MKSIHDFKDVISLWPTAADYGRDLKIDEGTARAMKRRNSIPSQYWAPTVSAAEKRGLSGVTFETLAKIAAKT